MEKIPPTITVEALIEHYSALLLDAYGVLVDKSGPLPGAAALIDELNREGKPYYLLTNSASRLPTTMATELAQWGLAIPAERIISSGSLLTPYFREHVLDESPCVVLGPEDSKQFVTDAGGHVLDLEQAGDETEVVVIADQKGFDCLEGMNRVLTLMLHRLDRGKPLHLLLCNPDIIYPVASDSYGFTAGGLAAMLEAILADRYPDEAYRFVRLGKPHAPIYEEAIRQAGTRDIVMLGDQLSTDILGANRIGIDSVLVQTGVSNKFDIPQHTATPCFIMDSLKRGLKIEFSC